MSENSHDSTRKSDDVDLSEPVSMLHPFADELMEIAVRLREAAQGRQSEDVGEVATNFRAPKDYLVMARKAYALRRKRDTIFGKPDLFGEPAWDILLDLYIAQGEGKSVSVSSACIGSAAPATTGLRWLGVLADEGLVVRENDAGDHRRVLVRLTLKGRTAMERFFDVVTNV